jgi:hypothetical protein
VLAEPHIGKMPRCLETRTPGADVNAHDLPQSLALMADADLLDDLLLAPIALDDDEDDLDFDDADLDDTFDDDEEEFDFDDDDDLDFDDDEDLAFDDDDDDDLRLD